jgi:hypothetical protein
MKINILATAAALSDQDLLARLSALAGRERETSVELLAHLVALEARPAVYSAQGYGSLYGYCTQALRLSEDAACNRIETARACRRFPVILDLLGSGEMTLTSVRRLGRYLTPENHQNVIERARRRTRTDIDALVAELDPRPDARSSVRRLPTCTPPPRASQTDAPVATNASSDPAPTIATPPPALVASPRPVVRVTAPQRYRVQFTIGEEAHDKLRRLQALLRREIPDGDPGKIFERAATLLLQKVERTKLGATVKPRPQPIRPATDRQIEERVLPSRHIPNDVKRAVYLRDGGQYAFVAAAGKRCTERTFLHFHHIQPYAKHGPATVENIALRCRRHNQYEAELVFGPHVASIVREAASISP